MMKTPLPLLFLSFFFFFKYAATPDISPLPLHAPLPIWVRPRRTSSASSRRRTARADYPPWGFRGGPVSCDRHGHPVARRQPHRAVPVRHGGDHRSERSEEHTSELQSQSNLVCRLLLEKK